MEEAKVNEEELLRVGGIITTHGLKGEVKIFPTTEDPRRFLELKEVYLCDKKGRYFLLHIESAKVQPKQVLLKFREFSDINEVEGYKKCQLYVDRAHAIPLEEGEYFVADLIGLDVFSDDGSFTGTLSDVLQTGANDVYVIHEKDTGRELLLPVIPQCVLGVSLKEHRVDIHILKGLLEDA